MRNDLIIASAWLFYFAIACVVFGFFVATFISKGPFAVMFGFIVSAIWPVSGLVWFGVWLA